MQAQINIEDTIEYMGHSFLILLSILALVIGYTSYKALKDGYDLNKKVKDLKKQ